MPKIIYVDKKDKIIGQAEKLKVHRLGLLHRAFSIFVFNSRGELLIQKRAKGKYHSGGLWSNTCCSHQRPEETLKQAAHQRLKEEMGFDCRLKELFSFHYRVKFKNGLVENELDHVFLGRSNKTPRPDPNEAADYRYISIKELKREIKARPGNYTAWLKVIIKKFLISDTF